MYCTFLLLDVLQVSFLLTFPYKIAALKVPIVDS